MIGTTATDIYDHIARKITLDQFTRLLLEADEKQRLIGPDAIIPGRKIRWIIVTLRGMFHGRPFHVEWHDGDYWLVGRKRKSDLVN